MAQEFFNEASNEVEKQIKAAKLLSEYLLKEIDESKDSYIGARMFTLLCLLDKSLSGLQAEFQIMKKGTKTSSPRKRNAETN